MVERWCSGESSIQVIRVPRLEAESWAWDWPIVMGEPVWDGELCGFKEKSARAGKNDRRTRSRGSRVYSIDMSALAHCCCEYNGAVTLTGTDFKDMRARRNVP